MNFYIKEFFVNIEYNPEIQQEIKSTSPNISDSQQLSNPFVGIDIFKKKSNTILPGVTYVNKVSLFYLNGEVWVVKFQVHFPIFLCF
jgi:glutamine cyclotransferase